MRWTGDECPGQGSSWRLARDPKSVATLADEGDVRLRRRDGVSLLLTREDRAGATQAGSLTAARALRDALVHLGDHEAARALQEEFPWVDQLLPEDIPLFVGSTRSPPADASGIAPTPDGALRADSASPRARFLKELTSARFH